MIGKCLWFDVKKGFGFLRAQDQDIFVHYSKILAPIGEFRLLEEGDVVEFDIFMADRGDGDQKPQAKNVKKIEENGNEIQRKEPDSTVRGYTQRAEADQVF
jgi:CspA family cold shock protein